jgi:outer membrane receptor protein involved in Fe transport
VPEGAGLIRFPGGVGFQRNLNSQRVGAEAALDRRLDSKHTLTAGLSLERESTFDLKALSNFDFAAYGPLPAYQEVPSLVPDASRTVFSLFAQDAWDPTARVGVVAGLRLDSYTDFGTSVQPRLGLVGRLPRGVNVKANYGRTVRTPTFQELFYSGPAYRATPTLEPATIDTFDLAALYRGRDTRVSATFYVSALRDVIAPAVMELRGGAGGLVPYVNIEGIDARGLELEASRTFTNSRSVNVAYGYQRPIDKATGERLGGSTSHLGRLSANFGAGRYLTLSPALTFRGGRTRLAGDQRSDLDGYSLFDLVVRARNFHPRWEIVGTVQNLFDTEYFEPSPLGGLPGDYPRPGRGVFVKARYKF